jgi:DNA-binding NarL/FixJ family response regulator
MTTYQRILLVDSDMRFRRMVKAMIRRHHPRIIVHEAQDQQGALQEVKCFAPKMILTEIDLYGRRILDLPRKMHALDPGCNIVVLSSYDLPEYRAAAFEAGAQYFISKSAPTGEAIRSLVEEVLGAAPSDRRRTEKGAGNEQKERKKVSGRGAGKHRPEHDRSPEKPGHGRNGSGAPSKRSTS